MAADDVQTRELPETGGKTVCQTGGADAQAQAMREAVLRAGDTLTITGTIYYVSSCGCDQNNGKSPETALRSFEGIKSLCYELKAGDGVLLERGGVYRLPYDLDLTDGVTYGAYGTGEKPAVYGSYRNYAVADLWTPHDAGTIWRIAYFPHTDAGIVVFNHGEEAGTKRNSVHALIHNGDYYHDLDEHVFYLCCDRGNPGEVYADIEIGVMTRLFHLKCNAHDITIDNLCFRYTGLFAVRGDGHCRNIRITNCEIGWLGGSLFPNRSNRFGNGVEFSSGCDNVLIENCWFHQIFDAGATFQIGSEPFRNFTVRNNLFEYTGMGGFEWWASGRENDGGGDVPLDETVIENIRVEHNIIRFSGYGWSRDTRCPVHIRGTWMPRDYPNLKSFYVTDNIFDCSYGFIMSCAWSEPPSEYVLRANTYYQKPTKNQDPAVSGYPAFDLVINQPTYADDQNGLEAAVKRVEAEPKMVKWLD